MVLFQDAKKLEDITVIVDGVLFNKNGSKLILNLSSKKESSYSIPTNVTSICEMAFYRCSSLSSITLPVNLTLIGNYAFKGCSSLS